MLTQPDILDPERDYAAPDSKEIAVAVTVTAQVSPNRSIVMQTYLPRDAHPVLFHRTVDKLTKVVDRQEAALQIDELEANIEQQKTQLKNVTEDFERIEERNIAAWEKRGKQGVAKLSEAETAQRRTAAINIERTHLQIQKLEAILAQKKAVILDVN